MKRNQKLVNRLDEIYGELKKAEKQIKRQKKEMKEECQIVLTADVKKAKKAIKGLYWSYEFMVKYENNSNNNAAS